MSYRVRTPCCLFRNLAQCTFFMFTLYIYNFWALPEVWTDGPFRTSNTCVATTRSAWEGFLDMWFVKPITVQDLKSQWLHFCVPWRTLLSSLCCSKVFSWQNVMLQLQHLKCFIFDLGGILNFLQRVANAMKEIELIWIIICY